MSVIEDAQTQTLAVRDVSNGTVQGMDRRGIKSCLKSICVHGHGGNSAYGLEARHGALFNLATYMEWS